MLIIFIFLIAFALVGHYLKESLFASSLIVFLATCLTVAFWVTGKV